MKTKQLSTCFAARVSLGKEKIEAKFILDSKGFSFNVFR
jgi:hypothetical protein